MLRRRPGEIASPISCDYVADGSEYRYRSSNASIKGPSPRGVVFRHSLSSVVTRIMTSAPSVAVSRRIGLLMCDADVAKSEVGVRSLQNRLVGIFHPRLSCQ